MLDDVAAAALRQRTRHVPVQRAHAHLHTGAAKIGHQCYTCNECSIIADLRMPLMSYIGVARLNIMMAHAGEDPYE